MTYHLGELSEPGPPKKRKFSQFSTIFPGFQLSLGHTDPLTFVGISMKGDAQLFIAGPVVVERLDFCLVFAGDSRRRVTEVLWGDATRGLTTPAWHRSFHATHASEVP